MDLIGQAVAKGVSEIEAAIAMASGTGKRPRTDHEKNRVDPLRRHSVFSLRACAGSAARARCRARPSAASPSTITMPPPPRHARFKGWRRSLTGLRIGETDMRLFGVVPPQLAASFGPQARAALDSLTAGQDITCQIRDRDHEGDCWPAARTRPGSDLVLELLKRGLAVSARGSSPPRRLRQPTLPRNRRRRPKTRSVVDRSSCGSVSCSIGGSAAVPQGRFSRPAIPAPEPRKRTTKLPPSPTKPHQLPRQTKDNQAKIAADLIDARRQANDERWQPAPQGFFARYQILISGVLMLATALGICAALWTQKRRDRQDEIRSIAAALRGELMAARAVCHGRLKIMAEHAGETSLSWPRLRSTLYQAYVGRLGMLGADVARQVAAIYGRSGRISRLLRHGRRTARRHAEKAGSGSARALHRRRSAKTGADRTDGTNGKPASGPRPTPALASPTCRPSNKPLRALHPLNPPAGPMDYAAAAARSPSALWQTVCRFVQQRRSATTQPPAYHAPVYHAPVDDAATDYAALIEADMARYPHGHEMIEPQQRFVQRNENARRVLTALPRKPFQARIQLRNA